MVLLKRRRASSQGPWKGVVLYPRVPDSAAQTEFYVGERAVVLDAFDVIDMGRSRDFSLLQCTSDPHQLGLDPFIDPNDPAAVLARHSAELATCGSASGVGLALHSHESMVSDIESVRRALRESRITLIGFDTVARDVAHYASTRPDSVRAVLLAFPALNATLDSEVELDFSQQHQSDADRFLSACARDLHCSLHDEPGPAARLAAVLTRASVDEQWDLLDGVLHGSWKTSEWRSLTDEILAVEQRVAGIGSVPDAPAASVSLGSWSPSRAMQRCYRDSEPRDPATAAAYLEALRRVAPLEAALLNLSDRSTCFGYPNSPRIDQPILTSVRPAILSTSMSPAIQRYSDTPRSSGGDAYSWRLMTTRVTCAFAGWSVTSCLISSSRRINRRADAWTPVRRDADCRSARYGIGGGT